MTKGSRRIKADADHGVNLPEDICQNLASLGAFSTMWCKESQFPSTSQVFGGIGDMQSCVLDCVCGELSAVLNHGDN